MKRGIGAAALVLTGAVLLVAAKAEPRITVTRTPFRPRSPAAAKPFTRMEAWHIGIDKPNDFSIGQMFAPFDEMAGSVAATDFDGDGDVDVVMASTTGGILLFANDGTGHFTRQPLDLPTISQMHVFNAAPADLDNDGWPDLFVTAHHQGDYVLWNDHGRFSEKRMTAVARPQGAVLDEVVAFGDLDRDGYLDVALGSHVGVRIGWMPGEADRDRVLFNEHGKLTGDAALLLPGAPGDTLTMLFSDFDQDGFLDLMEGNDFNQPDSYYLGDGTRALHWVRRQDRIIPVTTHTTMSMKTADLDNDLTFEIYLAQIAGRFDGASEKLRMQAWAQYCPGLERDADRRACQANVDLRAWYHPGGPRLDAKSEPRCRELSPRAQGECLALVRRDVAIKARDVTACDAIDPAQVAIRISCRTLIQATPEGSDSAELDYPDDVRQLIGRNVLLVRGPDGYRDKAVAAGLDVTGWTWDVKIEDFDEDGFLDVYVLNGWWNAPEKVPAKMLFRNQGGLRFEEAAEAFGLSDFLVLPSAAAADFDGDGDVDLVATAINGPPVAFWNNRQQGHAIAFEFRDAIGNRFGIGNTLVVHYGAAGAQHQIRELHASGGFGSFDPPVLHVGLGASEQVDRIEVTWSTGEKTDLPGPFAAGTTYRITRGP